MGGVPHGYNMDRTAPRVSVRRSRAVYHWEREKELICVKKLPSRRI